MKKFFCIHCFNLYNLAPSNDEARCPDCNHLLWTKNQIQHVIFKIVYPHILAERKEKDDDHRETN